LYNDDEIEDDYPRNEMSDDAEESEDRDDGSDHMSSVPFDVMDRAIETIEQSLSQFARKCKIPILSKQATFTYLDTHFNH
jgi:hypothetical protein